MRPGITFASDFGGPASFKASDLRLASLESLLGRAGRIDDRPIDRADLIFLLKPGDLRRRVGCVALTKTDTAQSGRKVRYEKEADKPHIQPARGIADRGSLRFPGKHRIDHGRRTLRKDPHNALH